MKMIARYCTPHFAIMKLQENGLNSYCLQAVFLQFENQYFFILP